MELKISEAYSHIIIFGLREGSFHGYFIWNMTTYRVNL